MSIRRFQLTSEFLCPFPALVPTVSLISGILLVLGPGLRLWPWPLTLLLLGIVAISSGTIFRNQWCRAGLACASGALWAGVFLWAPWQSYRSLLPGPESHAEVEAVVVDTRLLTRSELADLSADRNLELQLLRLRLHPDEPWRSCRGKVLLQRAEQSLSYGQVVRFEGAFLQARNSSLPHQFQFRNYLRSRGVSHLVQARELLIISETRGWRRLPAAGLRTRDWLLFCLLREVPGEDSQRLLAAMTLGLRGGLSDEDRRAFLRSGELHLFAISGLHVGIGFSIILLLLTVLRIPCRWRFLLGPLLLLGYVLAAGAQPSALRAWLMLSTWSIGKGLYLPVQAVNTVLTSALLLLLLNPLYLLHAGFQYSYILVLCLLLGWGWGQRLTGYALERQGWIPLRAQSSKFRQRAAAALLRASMAMLIFSLGAFGLTLWYNQIFLPFSIITNLGAGLLAWLILFISCFKLAFGMICSVLGVSLPSLLCGQLLAGLIVPLRWWAEVASANAFVVAVSQPSGVVMLLYYACLAVLVMSPPRLPALVGRAVLLAGAGALAVAGGPPGRTGCRIDVLVPNGSNTPILCIRQPGEKPILINTGTAYFGSRLERWLTGEGIDELGLVLLSSRRQDASGGIARLVELYPVETVAALSAHPAMRRRLEPGMPAGSRSRLAEQGRLQLAEGQMIETDTGWRLTLNTRQGPLVILWDQRRFESATLSVHQGDSDHALWQQRFAYADHDRHWTWSIPGAE